VTSLESAMKSIEKNRVTVYWPYYPEFDSKTLEEDISILVDHMFKISDSNPDSTFTFILDEASIVITPTRVPSSLKRLSVQGRAKGIKPNYISQRPLTNRWLDGNLSNVILFRMLPVDADNLSKRWGLDFTKSDETIRKKDYSFMRFDLESTGISFMNPVPLPKRIPRKKKTFKDKISDLFS